MIKLSDTYICAYCGNEDVLTTTFEDMLQEYIELNGTDKGYNPNDIVCDECFEEIQDFYKDGTEARRLLQEMVEEENYEEAAVLRDIENHKRLIAQGEEEKKEII